MMWRGIQSMYGKTISCQQATRAVVVLTIPITVGVGITQTIITLEEEVVGITTLITMTLIIIRRIIMGLYAMLLAKLSKDQVVLA